MESNASPYIYTSFVSTIDGKVFVKKPGYWPIGSQEDFRRFTELRAKADLIIDGKNTALTFADKTITTIHSDMFLDMRKKLGIDKKIQYGVLTQHPTDELVEKFNNSYGFKPLLITSTRARVSHVLNQQVELVQEEPFDLQNIIEDLSDRGLQNIFVDGGPQLITSLIAENLLDEIFLTIAPKVFGGEKDVTITMAEGGLLSADSVKNWHLKSVEQVGDEVFLQYAKP